MHSAVRLEGLSLPLILLFVATSFAQEAGSKQEDSQSSQSKSKSSAGEFYEVDSLNQGVPQSNGHPDLSTPLATVENFMLACRDQDFLRAAQSLNFKLIPKDQRPEAADFGPEVLLHA